MATWSRSQSQDAGMCKGASSGIKTKCSTILARDARIMAANKRENARIIRWAEEAADYTKVRKYSDTITVKLSRKTKRALGGRVMSAANHAAIAANKATASSKAIARKAFFAELGVTV